MDRRDLDKLQQAITWSRRQLEPFRRNRVEFLRQYVGSRYSNDGSPQDVIVNLLETMVNTYVR